MSGIIRDSFIYITCDVIYFESQRVKYSLVRSHSCPPTDAAQPTALGLIANVVVALVPAHLAVYATAPHEAAATLLLVVADTRLVAAPAAEEPASVQTRRRSVARATASTQNSQPAQREKHLYFFFFKTQTLL